MRDITHFLARKLRQRTARRAKQRKYHADIALAKANSDAKPEDKFYKDGIDLVKAVGVNPKYLSAHARRRLTTTEDDFILARTKFIQARDRARIEAEKAKKGKKAVMEVRA